MSLLAIIAKLWLILGFLCAAIIAIDILKGHRQKMMIMNFVYPITALYGGLLALIFYYVAGRTLRVTPDHEQPKPFPLSVAIATLHCGSGCTIGDILAEIFVAYISVSVFGSMLAGKWTLDYAFAFLIGIIFQYYSIKPMKKLSPGKALKAALKADALSLTFWQIGMYGWMAIVIFCIFGNLLSAHDPLFWFMMQVAMMFGFITAYPINWWLIKRGIKEVM